MGNTSLVPWSYNPGEVQDALPRDYLCQGLWGAVCNAQHIYSTKFFLLRAPLNQAHSPATAPSAEGTLDRYNTHSSEQGKGSHQEQKTNLGGTRTILQEQGPHRFFLPSPTLP